MARLRGLGPVIPRRTDDSLPDVLYHYTNVTAAAAILTKQHMWASHIGYLNDGGEIGVAFKLIQDGLITIQRQYLDSPIITQIISLLVGNIEFRGPSLRLESPILITSFTSDGKSLSQYRMYGGQSGVCLAYQRELIEKFFDSTNQRFSSGYMGGICRCLYDEEEQRAFVAKQLGELFKVLEDVDADDILADSSRMRRVYTAVMLRLLPLAAQMKHHSFKEEKEFRLIILRTSAVPGAFKFTERAGLLRPYVEWPCALEVEYHEPPEPLPYEETAICGVTLGPSPVQEENSMSLDLIARGAVNGIPVSKFDSTYRG